MADGNGRPPLVVAVDLDEVRGSIRSSPGFGLSIPVAEHSIIECSARASLLLPRGGSNQPNPTIKQVLGYFVATLVRFHNEAYGTPPLTVRVCVVGCGSC